MHEPSENFEFEWHGNAVVIIPAANTESMQWDLIEQSAEVLITPLRGQEVPTVIMDLSEIRYFGSVFLELMLRIHKFAKGRGGELLICGASHMARELLQVTQLDTLWAIYDTREEALEACDF